MAQSTLELILRSRKTGTGAKEAEQELDALGKKTSQFGAIAKGVAVAGIGALVGGLALSVNQAVEAERVMAATEAVIKSTGGVAGLTADEVGKLADSLSHMSGVDDELIQSAENVMLTFTSIGKDVFPSAMEAALNMSTALGTDLQGSVIQIGKALQDPINGITALRRVGVNFNDEAKTTIKRLVETGQAAEAQAFILKELSTEFGGAAKAAGDTFGGQLKKLENELGNAFEAIGTELIPIIKALIPVAMGAVDALKGVAAIVRDIAIVTGATKPTVDDMTRAVDAMAASGKFSAEAIAEARARIEEYRTTQENSLAAAQAWNENVTEGELVIRGLKSSVVEAIPTLDELKLTEEELEKAEKAAAQAAKEQADKMEEARLTAANFTIGAYDLAQSLVKVGEATFVKQALEGLDLALKEGTISQADYKLATEQLLLSSGLATEKSLEMANTVTYLNGLLASGQISTTEYSAAMQLIPVAARDSNITMAELNIHLETARERALKARDAMGTAGMADAIASAGGASEDLIPKLEKVAAGASTAAGAAGALAGQANAARDAINSIPDQKDVTITTYLRTVQLEMERHRERENRQFGGMVSAGDRVRVHPPEMFFPASNGFIMSQSDTRHMLSLLEQIAGGLGRSNNITINGGASAGSVAEAVSRLIGARADARSRMGA